MPEEKSYCQTCGDIEVRVFLPLGEQPACHFPVDAAEADVERFWPLDLAFCEQCGLVQIAEPVDERILFSGDYHHLAGLTKGYREHLRGLADRLAELYEGSPRRAVVEIGSNDGSLLDELARRGFGVTGIDPCGTLSEGGVPAVTEFFGSANAPRLAAEHGTADVVLALNTFAHVTDMHDFLGGVRAILDEDGTFVTESHYLPDLLEGMQYDFAYHEHSRYYSITALDAAFSRHGLETFRVERIPTHGGSIRVYAGVAGVHAVEESVTELRESEDSLGLTDGEVYSKFASRVQDHRDRLRDTIATIRSTGARVAASSAPARAVTLLNYCSLGPEDLEFVAEISPRKIGRLFPGTHIPVVDQAALCGESQPDYALLLSWHIADQVIPRLRDEGFRGRFIVPLPDVRIVD